MLHRRLFRSALSRAVRLARTTVHLTRRRPSSLGPPGRSAPQPVDAPAVAPRPEHLTNRGSPASSTAPVSLATDCAAPPEPARCASRRLDQVTGGVAVTDQPKTAFARPPTTDEAPPPAEAHHERGLAMARAHRWNWAQRELELAARMLSDDPIRTDLETVRSARRYLRALQKRPRDARTHILLGKCYFELDMGEDAEREFRHAMAIAPEEPEPHYFLALEYCYRGMTEEAEQYYAQAQSLVEGLPPFSSLLAEYQQVAHEEPEEQNSSSPTTRDST